MSKEKNKTSLEEAFFEINTIMEAAAKKAKDALANEMPEKFEDFLSEELNNNKKESVNESQEDNTKEPVVEGKKNTDDNKESLNEMDELDMREMSMSDVEEAYDEANSDDEFNVELTIDDIAQELGDDAPAEEVPVEPEIEEAAADESDPYGKFKQLYEMMSEMIKEMDDTKKHNELQEKFDLGMVEMYGEGYKESLGEEKCNELFEMYKSKDSKIEETTDINESVEASESVVESEDNNAKEEEPVNETEVPVQESENDDEDREEEEVVDETAGSAKMHSLNRTVGNENLPHSSPRKDSTQREFQKESVDKKVASLIKENKKVNIELQEAVNANAKYKEVLEKYRNQLQEMAVVNTNIAHVNDILIKESDIPSERVQTIIDGFKDIESITESEDKYKTVLSEMTQEKETLDESIEKKIIDSVGESSSKKITEQVNEKTAFGNSHLSEIKRRMNYMVSK